MDEQHAGPAPRDDPSARARADVRAILSRALGLRRIVELAGEIRAERHRADHDRAEHHRGDNHRADNHRAERWRRHPQTG